MISSSRRAFANWACGLPLRSSPEERNRRLREPVAGLEHALQPFAETLHLLGRDIQSGQTFLADLPQPLVCCLLRDFASGELLGLVALGFAGVLHLQHADERWQREALDQHGPDRHDEREELDLLAPRRPGGYTGGGGEGDNPAHPGPRDDREDPPRRRFAFSSEQSHGLR